MTKSEHLLNKLMEEAAEVIQRVSKANRFGLGEIQPGQELTNAERILEEVVDVFAAFEMVVEAGLIDAPTDQAWEDMVDLARLKFKNHHEFSEARGLVDGVAAMPEYERPETAKSLPPVSLRERRVVVKVEAVFRESDVPSYALVTSPRVRNGLHFRLYEGQVSSQVWARLEPGKKLLASCNADAEPGDRIHFWDISIFDGNWEVIDNLQEYASRLAQENQEGR